MKIYKYTVNLIDYIMKNKAVKVRQIQVPLTYVLRQENGYSATTVLVCKQH